MVETADPLQSTSPLELTLNSAEEGNSEETPSMFNKKPRLSK